MTSFGVFEQFRVNCGKWSAQNSKISKFKSFINYVLKGFFSQPEPLSGKKIHSSRARNGFFNINIAIKNIDQNPSEVNVTDSNGCTI